MKTFEERYTAWIDGQLSGPELERFEAELGAAPEAEADRAGAQRLGDFLRRHSGTPKLANADFFTHQIMHRIASEAAEAPAPARRRWWQGSLRQLAWAGAASLLVAGLL